MPQVQTAIVQKVTKSLSQKLNTTLRINRVDIDFFKTVVLEGIYVEDQQQDTLLYAQELRVNLGVLSLMNKTINVNLIGLENAVVHISRPEGDSTYNFAFIPEAFASTDTTAQDTTASAWDFDLEEINLKQVRFTMDDQYEGNDLQMGVKSFLVDFQTLGLEEQYPKINEINIDGLNLAFSQPFTEADTLAEAVAQTTQADTIAGAIAKSVKGDTLKQEMAQKEDSVETPFNSSGYRLTVNDFIIQNSNLRYQVKGAPAVEKGIDFNNLDVRNLLIKIADVEVGENNFALDLDNFSFQERSGFDLQALAMEFNANMPQVEVNLQKFQTPNSVLDDGVRIQIASINDTDNLLRQIKINASFEDDSLGFADATYFTDALASYPPLNGAHVFLDGGIEVNGENAQINSLTASFNPDNFFTIDGSIRDLYNLAQAFVDIRITPFKTSTNFVQGFVPKGTLPPEFSKAGNIVLSANLRGYLRDMKGNIDLQTSAGAINTNFTAGTDTSFTRNHFDGTLAVNQLDLERFLGKASKLGNLNMRAQIKGSRNGDDIALQQGAVNLQSLRYNGYTYRDIQLKGSYLRDIANATLTANDRNLQANLEAAANLQGKQPSVALKGEIQEVDLYKLNLTTDTISFRTAIDAAITGTDPDEMIGNVNIYDIAVQKAAQRFELDSVILALDKIDDTRIIQLRSDIVSARAEGQYTLEELPLALNLFIKKYLTTYPVEDRQLTSNQSVNFEMAVVAHPKIIEGFVAGLDIPQPINIAGNFTSADNRLNLEGAIPQLTMQTQQITDLRLDVNTNNDKLSFDVQAAQVQLSESLIIPKPRIAANIDEDNLQFNINLASPENPSRLALNGRFRIKQDTFIVSFDPSELYLKNQQWILADNGKIVYAPEYLFVDNFELSQGSQRIAINSRRVDADDNALFLTLAGIKIAEIFELVGPPDYTLGGLIDGEVQVANMFDVPAVQADVRVDTFRVNESTVGNIAINADRNAEGGIGMKATVSGASNDINIEGSYFPEKDTNNISLDVAINQIALEQFAPLVQESVTEMRGNLNANIAVRGSFSEPAVTGDIIFRETLIRPTILGAPFTITDQRINFRDQAVAFNEFTIADEDNRTAVLSGLINYQDLENILTDLTFRTDGFQFLNARTGESFYGRAYASTNLRIQGPVNNMVLTGNVRTLPNTQLFLPVYSTGGAEAERPEYITFIGQNTPPADDDASEEEPEEVALSGFSVNMRATVTSDAEINVIISEGGSDNVRALGDGTFDIRMTPQGDLLIAGVYTIQEGSYSMTLLGAVKKQFDIREGSTISINGPPDEAELNITAVYGVETSLADLVPAYTQEVPVNVVANIEGNMEELNVGFDIEVPGTENSSGASELEAELDRIRANETELNKQVFALVALNRFFPQDNNLFAGDNSGGGYNAALDKGVSQVLSQQLNNLAQDYLGVQVDVNVESGESGALTDRNVGVNLSKQLFDDRLSVSVGGQVGLGSSTNSSMNANANSAKNIIGDFTIDYRLLPSGNLNLRFFRKNENDVIRFQQVERIGFSLAHRKNFNQWKYLFKSRSRELRRAPMDTPVSE